MIVDKLQFNKNDRIFFTADTHFGHKNIIRYCKRPFVDVEEMNETLIDSWNSTVGKDDIVFHLGDFAMGGSAEWSRFLERLNGRIYLILGNHDMKTIGKGFSRLELVTMQMLINIGGQRIYLNHYPFLCFGGAYRNTWQLFGHVHTSPYRTGLDSSRLDYLFPTQYDVGVDNNNYMPLSFKQVNVKIQQQLNKREQKNERTGKNCDNITI